jgi:hypothetical protein
MCRSRHHAEIINEILILKTRKSLENRPPGNVKILTIEMRTTYVSKAFVKSCYPMTR